MEATLKPTKELKAIRKSEAEAFDNKELKEELHKQAMEEAIEELNTAIKINYADMRSGRVAATPPLQKCFQYQMLMGELQQMYSPNGFEINWAPNSPVITIRLAMGEPEEAVVMD